MGKSTAKNPTVNQPAGSPKGKNARNVLPRNQVQDEHDPYLPDGHYPDRTVCSRCGALYQNQHWTLDAAKSALLLSSGTANEVVCPGCRKVESHDPHGVVTLRGDYWPQHRDDIMNLIRNEEKRGMNTNPLERIMEIREEDSALVISTTNEKLAQRIGRSLHNAHKGEVEYKWPDGDRLVRVEWERHS